MKPVLTFLLGVFAAAAFLLLEIPTLSAAETTAFPEVMFILDASGSMWGEAGGQTKIEAARSVLSQIVPSLPPEVQVGLTVYGHRRKGDCSDIEILIPSGNDRAGLLAQVQGIHPKGMTPIANAIQAVADTLKGHEGETTIVLISDGEETCHDDPCGVVQSLKKSGINFLLHVVGFGVDSKANAQLECLAREGGGSYFTASNAGSLLAALETVKQQVAEKVEQAKTTSKKAASGLGKLELRLPADSAVSINTFKIIRKQDGKLIKTVTDPSAQQTHPLLSGDYELIAGFANSNYWPDSEVSFGDVTVTGGETVRVDLGEMIINIADSLKDMPAGAVIITREEDKAFNLVIPYTGNSYYFYKPKPLPQGTYTFAVHYKQGELYRTRPEPVILADGVRIGAGEQKVVTIDSGILIKKVLSSPVLAWEMVKAGTRDVVVRIDRASNGDYPLWMPYAVRPGSYDLYIYLEGMDEPLPAGKGVSIAKGDLLEFDTGL